MRNGFLRLIRGLAVFGMAMAFVDFTLGVVNWAGPSRGSWVGKRMKDAMELPSGPGRPDEKATAGTLQRHFRHEIGQLYAGIREPSQWFLLASVVYLLARRQIRDETPPDSDTN